MRTSFSEFERLLKNAETWYLMDQTVDDSFRVACDNPGITPFPDPAAIIVPDPACWDEHGPILAKRAQAQAPTPAHAAGVNLSSN